MDLKLHFRDGFKYLAELQLQIVCQYTAWRLTHSYVDRREMLGYMMSWKLNSLQCQIQKDFRHPQMSSVGDYI